MKPILALLCFLPTAASAQFSLLPPPPKTDLDVSFPVEPGKPPAERIDPKALNPADDPVEVPGEAVRLPDQQFKIPANLVIKADEGDASKPAVKKRKAIPAAKFPRR